MAFMESAHGGNQAYGLVIAARKVASLTDFSDAVADLHGNGKDVLRPTESSE
jgi:hypothetical protein